MCVVFTVRNVSDLQSKVAFSVEVYHRNLNNKIDKRNTVLCVVGNYCRQLCVLMLCTIRVFARHVCVCVSRGLCATYEFAIVENASLFQCQG